MVRPGIWKISLLLLTGFIMGCDDDPDPVKTDKKITQPTPPPALVAPAFNADSAYHYIEAQVAFGPRVPNTEAHKKTGQYLVSKMESFGWQVETQETVVTAFNGDKLNIKNIIASHLPEAADRILLFAHWDTRPFADQDETDRNKPIPGANDGGSGVGVLMEIARQIGLKSPGIGVDIIFFDAEDYGQPADVMMAYQNDTYCLGSQYWAKNLPTSYSARFGILLDMVGSADATFTQEGTSMYYAPAIVRKVWQTAHQLGYSNYFLNRQTDAITDDHSYVNQLAGIPSIDIIHFDPNTNSNFGAYWHTHDDNMEVISRETLKAVGQTVSEVVYREGK